MFNADCNFICPSYVSFQESFEPLPLQETVDQFSSNSQF